MISLIVDLRSVPCKYLANFMLGDVSNALCFGRDQRKTYLRFEMSRACKQQEKIAVSKYCLCNVK